jgi:hypothetical protein
MPQAGFEPVSPASERPLTRALDRAATGILIVYSVKSSLLQTRIENAAYYLKSSWCPLVPHTACLFWIPQCSSQITGLS